MIYVDILVVNLPPIGDNQELEGNHKGDIKEEEEAMHGERELEEKDNKDKGVSNNSNKREATREEGVSNKDPTEGSKTEIGLLCKCLPSYE